MIICSLVIGLCVLIFLTAVLGLALVDVCNRLRDINASQHDACVWRMAGVVSAEHAAQVLSQAADDWDSIEEQGHLRILANERYKPGGPSMPEIWLRDRADRYRQVQPAKIGASE